MNPDSYTRVEWRKPFEFHYQADSTSGLPIPGPLIVYDPIRQEARSQTIIPCPGLIVRGDPQFDATARRTSSAKCFRNDAFSIKADGIYLSNPYITGIEGLVEHLHHTHGFEQVFQRCPLPETRWENASLLREDETPAWANYCSMLRQLYGNGFVRLQTYRIAESSLNDHLLLKWPGYTGYIPFLELMRHPMIDLDFFISSRDDEILCDSSNWEGLSPFLFSGWLAQVLSYGGAYSSAANRLPQVLEAADKVFREVNRDYRNFGLWVNRKPWMKEFYDVAWDHTWIILDREARRLTILMASDTD
ncbi:MAG: hypothetical protein ACK5TH_02740 [Prosthecobacter sp.]